jgi:hypothetical protein
MSFPHLALLMRRVSYLGCTVFLAAGVASAQSMPSADQSNTAGYSSSQAGLSATGLQMKEFALPDSPEPSGSASEGSGAGQYGNGGGYGGEKHGLVHGWTFEAGGGFNAPISDAITYGGNFTVGGGVSFNRRLAALIEYQFIDSKLPGALIAETGATGGDAHIWSFTIDPVVDLFPKSNNDLYIVGGGGFYRKLTSFTDVVPTEYCDFYYGCGIYSSNQVVGHFSSNQGGFNIGGGYMHRLGGMYGDSNTKLFVEGRFLDVLSPAVQGLSPNGLGTITTVAADTKIIPVTVGVKF